MSNSQSEEEFEIEVSRVIIAYKFILGLIELIIGISVPFLGKYLLDIYQNFATAELFEDPNDLLASILDKLIPYILAHQGFIIFILILLGVTKMLGAIGLFYRKHWGLDILVAVTVLLLPFELFNIFTHPSILKVIYFLINMFIALYLVNFKPKHYFEKVKKRYRRKNKS